MELALDGEVDEVVLDKVEVSLTNTATELIIPGVEFDSPEFVFLSIVVELDVLGERPVPFRSMSG